MVEEAKKVVVVEIVTKTQKAVKQLNMYRADLNKTKRAMKELIAAGHELSAASGMLAGKVGLVTGGMEKAYTNADLLTQAEKELSTEMEGVGVSTTKTTRILERIFAAAIIGVVLNAVRRLINELKELADEAAEARKEFIQFVLEVKTAQEAGLGITLQEWEDRLDSLGERFTQFNRQELQDGVGKLIRLGRQIGLTDDEITALTDKIALLATVTGKDFPSAVDAAIQAITRGRLNEAVTRLFGGLNAPTLNTEAVRRGLAETTEEVTQYTRYLLLMQIAEEEAAKSGDKLALVQEDISGKLTEGSQDLVDLKRAVGEELLPAKLAWYNISLKLLEAFGWLIDRIQEFGRHLGSRFYAAIYATIEAVKALHAVLRGESVDFSWIDTFNQKADELFLWAGRLTGDIPGDFESFASSVEESSRKAAEAVGELSEAFEDALIKVRELFIDMGEDIAKENRKWEEQVLQDAAKFALKLEQLYEKLQFDIGKVNRTFNDKIVDAQDDYRDKEIKAEEDYQEKLRKLREGFLFDLEDALRERDARQITRLIRQYNLKKTQLERERGLEKADNKRNLEDQLEDIERQRAARLRELRLEYEFRRSQMIAQNEFEKNLREQQHLQRLAEIKQQTKEKFLELLRELEDSGELTEKEAEELAKIFDKYFGPDGAIEGSVDYLVQVIAGAVAAVITMIRRLRAALAGLSSFQPPSPPTHQPIIGMARGGTLFADTPTTVTFGEAGPEMAEFTPLNRSAKSLGDSVGQPSASRNDRIELMVRMEDGLIAEIIDTTLDQTATVVLNVERASL